MRDFITLVCGFGRCGSSLVMQMLSAGGMPTIGPFPSFEDDHSADVPLRKEWLAENIGKAIKVLDPHRCVPAGDLPYRVIWLDRNPKEQSRSQAKFLRMVCGVQMSRNETQKMAACYRHDRAKCMTLFGEMKVPLLILSFEGLFRDSTRSVKRIVDHVGGLEASKMEKTIVRRTSECAKGLEMELALLAQAAM